MGSDPPRHQIIILELAPDEFLRTRAVQFDSHAYYAPLSTESMTAAVSRCMTGVTCEHMSRAMSLLEQAAQRSRGGRKRSLRDEQRDTSSTGRPSNGRGASMSGVMPSSLDGVTR